MPAGVGVGGEAGVGVGGGVAVGGPGGVGVPVGGVGGGVGGGSFHQFIDSICVQRAGGGGDLNGLFH